MLIRVAESPCAYVYEGAVYFEYSLACIGKVVFSYSESGLKYLRYSTKSTDYKPYSVYWGEEQYTLAQNSKLTYETIRQGAVELFTSDGESLTAPQSVVKALNHIMFYRISGEVVALSRSDICEGYRLILIDTKRKTMKCSPECLGAVAVTNEGVIGKERAKNRICKLNLELQEVWASNLLGNKWVCSSGSSRSMFPVLANNLVIQYFGHLNDESMDDEKPIRRYKEGFLAAFNDDDGAEVWQRTFEWSVEDYVLSNECLYIATGQELHKVDPSTGESLAAINTGLVIPDFRGSTECIASLHVSEAFIYYLLLKEARISVYEKNSLSLIREYTLPPQWGSVGVYFEDTQTGLIYIKAYLLSNTEPDYHRTGVLVLDPNDKNLSLSMEPEPKIVVELKASSDEPSQEELWVTISDTDVDSMLRFGELYTQNHCYRNGKNYFASHCPPNPKFNGKVHFRCYDIQASASEITEKLKIFEERFILWNGTDDDEENSGKMFIYAGTDGKTLCTLEAALISD